VLGSDPRYTVGEIADKSGVDVEVLEATRRALGLAVPDRDASVYDEADVEAAKMHRRVIEAGFSEDHMRETNRVLGQGIARYVEALRTTIAEALVEPEADERELGRRFAQAGAELVPLNAPWMEHVFELHLRQMLRNEAVTFQERAAGRVGTRETAVGFADLVGFTELGQTMDVEELSDVAGRLQRMAAELVDPPVRFVKAIGDAVMLVAPEPPDLVETMLGLVERGDDTEDFPRLRAGVAYGPAASHFGDWFGSTVNLASRVTARARPGSVLVTESVRDALADNGYAISSAGPKRLKGIAEPVKTYRVRREQGA